MTRFDPLPPVQHPRRSSSFPLLIVVACGAVVILGGSGCGRAPSRIEAPEWDPATIAGAAFAQLDANSDGQITRKECEEAPGLLYGFRQVDADRDDQISAAELEDRFELYRTMGTGLRSQAFRVSWKRRPLSRAEIHLVPEPFQGGVIEPAQGTTDQMGMLLPRTEGQDIDAIRVGYYRVEVVSLSGGKVPDTPLGVEVSPVSDGPSSSGMIELEFK